MQALSQEVYNFLLQKLLRRKLLPGMTLNRRQIAIEMKVSVAPVLEAMIQLETEGFLLTVPRKGTYVRSINAEDIQGLLIVREALECQAARMYCGDLVKHNQEWLKDAARKADMQVPGSMERWKCVTAFHRALVNLAGCPTLTEEFDKVMKMGMFFAANNALFSYEDLENNSHERLVSLLLTNDPDQAERVIRMHLVAAREPKLSKVVV